MKRWQKSRGDLSGEQRSRSSVVGHGVEAGNPTRIEVVLRFAFAPIKALRVGASRWFIADSLQQE
jgi:hypothetical protein